MVTAVAVVLGLLYMVGLALLIVAIDTTVDRLIARRRARRDQDRIARIIADLEQQWEHR